MDDVTKVILLGRDHGTSREIYTRSLDGLDVALATSAGVTSKPNEDAAGAVVCGQEMVLAIADGHWGRDASEIAVSEAMKLLDPGSRSPGKNEIQARLFSLFAQVNDRLYELAATAPNSATPETTLIVCHIDEAGTGKYLHWSSFGDSYLFLFRNRHLRQINSLHPRWLGYLSRLSEKGDARALFMRFLGDANRFVGVTGGLETGLEKLESGDLVLLCTDGLIGSDQKPDPAVLDKIGGLLIADVPLVSKVENLISSALDRQEKDNISCLSALIL